MLFVISIKNIKLMTVFGEMVAVETLLVSLFLQNNTVNTKNREGLSFQHLFTSWLLFTSQLIFL